MNSNIQSIKNPQPVGRASEEEIVIEEKKFEVALKRRGPPRKGKSKRQFFKSKQWKPQGPRVYSRKNYYDDSKYGQVGNSFRGYRSRRNKFSNPERSQKTEKTPSEPELRNRERDRGQVDQKRKREWKEFTVNSYVKQSMKEDFLNYVHELGFPVHVRCRPGTYPNNKPVLNYLGRYAIEIFKKFLRNNPNYRCLDVGPTHALRKANPELSRRVHAIEVESVDSFMNIQNLKKISEPIEIPTGEALAMKDEWTWSIQDFRTLGEMDVRPVDFFDVAYFGHSLYYFTAQQVADVLVKTREMQAFATVNDYTHLKGEFSWSGSSKYVEQTYEIGDGRITVRSPRDYEAKYNHQFQDWYYKKRVNVSNGILHIAQKKISFVLYLEIRLQVTDLRTQEVSFSSQTSDGEIYRGQLYRRVEGVPIRINPNLIPRVVLKLMGRQIKSSNIISELRYNASGDAGVEFKQEKVESLIDYFYGEIYNKLVENEKRRGREYAINGAKDARRSKALLNTHSELATEHIERINDDYQRWRVVDYVLWRLFGIELGFSGEGKEFLDNQSWTIWSRKMRRKSMPWLRLFFYLLGSILIVSVVGTIFWIIFPNLFLTLTFYGIIVLFLSYWTLDWCLPKLIFLMGLIGKTNCSPGIGLIASSGFSPAMILALFLIGAVSLYKFYKKKKGRKKVKEKSKPIFWDMIRSRTTAHGQPFIFGPKCYIPAIQTTISVDDYPRNPNTKFNLRPKHYRKEDCIDDKGLYVIGPVFKTCLPVTYNSTIHNAVSAVLTRVLTKTPEPVLKNWHLGVVRRLLKEATKKIGTNAGWPLLVDQSEAKKMTFEEWNQRFATGKQATNRMHYEDIQVSKDLGNLTNSIFVKGEANVPLITKGDFMPQRPRVITDLAKKMKVASGPFAVRAAKVLGEAWNINHYITYAGGMTTTNLNTWINASRKNYWFVYTDFSKYDLTQKEASNRLEFMMYERMGINEHWWSHALFYTMLNTKGQFRKKNEKIFNFFVWCTRKSGSNFTSVGNSIINGAVWLFGLYLFCATTLRQEVLKDDKVQYSRRVEDYLFMILKKTSVRCILMGDDNMTVVDKCYSEKQVSLIYDSLNKAAVLLGFKMTGGYSKNPLDVDFLNMIPYPVNGVYRFGKKPGRNILKLGVVLARAKDWSKEEREAILRANLISYVPTSNHVPFLGEYVKLLSEYLGEGPTIKVGYQKTTWEGDVRDPGPDTWLAFTEKTSLTKEDELSFVISVKYKLSIGGIYQFLDEPLLDQLVNF